MLLLLLRTFLEVIAGLKGIVRKAESGGEAVAAALARRVLARAILRVGLVDLGRRDGGEDL